MMLNHIPFLLIVLNGVSLNSLTQPKQTTNGKSFLSISR